MFGAAIKTLLGYGSKALGFGGKALGWGAVAGGAYVAHGAATHERGLQGFISGFFDPAAQIAGGAGPEQTFAGLYKSLQLLGKFLRMLGVEGVGTALENFGKAGIAGKSTAEMEADRITALPLNDAGRAGERIYETAVTSGPDARYRIDGPNGSPPSVSMSDEAPTDSNTFWLGLKGVKDGLGVAVGWGGGLVAGAADLVGLDGKMGLNSGWASSASRGLSGAINETTDFLAYDVITKSLRMTSDGIAGLFNGKGLIDGAVDAFKTDYEPTIRSEFDRSVYAGTSTVSAVAVTAIGGSFLTGAFALNAGGAATLAEAAAAPMATTQIGAGILKAKAGTILSFGAAAPGVTR